MSDPSDLYGFVHGLCDVIRMVLLPLATSRSALLTKILDLIREMQEAELPVATVLPAILRHRPAAHDDVTSALRREFADLRHEFRLSALRGIVYWADAYRPSRKSNLLPPLPIDLLRELGAAVAQRRPGELSDALDGSIAVLRRFGTSADSQFLDSLIVGLDYLFKEAAYRLKDEAGAALKYDEVPLIRLQCARLAKQVAECGRAKHPIIQQWLKAAKDDPLPEVRAAVADTA